MNIGTMFKTQTGKSMAIILTEEGSLAFWQPRLEITWYCNLPYGYYKRDNWVEQ